MINKTKHIYTPHPYLPIDALTCKQQHVVEQKDLKVPLCPIHNTANHRLHHEGRWTEKKKKKKKPTTEHEQEIGDEGQRNRVCERDDGSPRW
jgi:hypothetical protein